VGIVLLVPLIWTALFHHRWESACVVAAIVAAEIVISVVQSAPDVVIVRRVLLWGALGALLGVATHGLRDRIRRSQEAAGRLQEQVDELMVVQDRDRLAADLQSSVVQRIFAASLSLQSVLAMATQAEVRRRVEASVADLDDAIRLLRQAIFGLENRMATEGLRHRILQLCAEVSPVPEITFAGPVDDALAAEASDQVLGMLRAALGQLGRRPDRPSSASGPRSVSALP
jgi:signal transduction histidine kinase